MTSSSAPTPLASRKVAVHLLEAVLLRRHFLDDAIAAEKNWLALEERDRGFARLLCATVLRRMRQCDAWIDTRLERPLPDRAARVRTILHLGMIQLACLGTPAHAALATSVELARVLGLPSYTGLVNALLRRFESEGPDLFAAQEASGRAARLSTPDWLWQSWSEAYGEDVCQAIATAHLKEAPLDLSFKTAQDAQSWAGRLTGTVLPTGSLRLESGKGVTSLDGYAEGVWWIQDAAAALPARLLGDVAGLRVADLCAAPGGKTSQLAAAGAQVTALDRSTRRLERLDENLTRLGLTATSVAGEVVSWRPETPFDAVLLDAPCSATGTIRRHPELMHLKTMSDCTALARAQKTLLAAALEMVKPGGTLIYCVCSLQPEEGENQIEALLGSGAPVRRQAVRPEEIGGLDACVTPAGDLRTLPCHLAEQGGMDGFFAARLVRLPE